MRSYDRLFKCRGLAGPLAVSLASLLLTADRRIVSAEVQSATFKTMFESYVDGNVGVVGTTLRHLSDYQEIRREYLKTSDKWIDSWRDSAKWRPIYPAFGLEIATVAVSNNWSVASEVVTLARKLMVGRPDLIGDVPRFDRFEVLWHRAMMTLLQRQKAVIAENEYLKDLELWRRIGPDPPAAGVRRLVDPGILLLAAIASEQETMPGALEAIRDRFVGAPAGAEPEIRGLLEEAVRRYQKAAAYEVNAAEALVRLARVLWRLGRLDQALAAVDASLKQPTADREILYLGHLFRGRILQTMGNHDEAASEYSVALSIWPGASAPSAALSAVYVLQGEFQRAVDVARTSRVSPVSQSDPWWSYWEGQGRFLLQRLAEVRAASR